MKILSIDASSNISGFSVMTTDEKLIESGIIDVTDKKETTMYRIINLYKQLNTLIDKHNPEHIIFEDLTRYYSRSLNALIALSYVHAMLEILCWLRGIEYSFVKVNKWRKDIGITEKTRDKQKQQAIDMIKEIYGRDCKTDDEAEAILLGLWYCRNNYKFF